MDTWAFLSFSGAEDLPIIIFTWRTTNMAACLSGRWLPPFLWLVRTKLTYLMWGKFNSRRQHLSVELHEQRLSVYELELEHCFTLDFSALLCLEITLNRTERGHGAPAVAFLTYSFNALSNSADLCYYVASFMAESHEETMWEAEICSYSLC